MALIALGSIFASYAGADQVTLGEFANRGSGAEELDEPGGIAVSPDGGSLFIADTENERIAEYTPRGEFVRAWGWGVAHGAAKLETCTAESECQRGQAGPGIDQLDEPVGVAVSPDGNTVYAINRAKTDGRILKFAIAAETVTSAGALPARYGQDGGGIAGFAYPLPPTNDLAVASDGTVYVADQQGGGANRIVAFDPTAGTFRSIPVEFGTITALAAGPDDEIYVAGDNALAVIEPGKEPVRFESNLPEISAMAFDPRSGHLLVETNEYETEEVPFGTNSNLLLREISDGQVVGTIPVRRISEPEEQPNPFGLAVDPTVEFDGYKPGAIFVARRYELSSGRINIIGDQAPGAPEVSTGGEFARPLGSDAEDLALSVNPHGYDTHVYVKYGPTPEYGSTAPAPPGIDVGDGFEGQPVLVHLTGLLPGTTYHFSVVATNAAESTVTEDKTFTTSTPVEPFALPDGRAWEQVTTEKGNGEIASRADLPGSSSPSGDGVSFLSSYIFPAATGASLTTSYVAVRDAAGWHLESASPPVRAKPGSQLLPNLTSFVSRDLGHSLGQSDRQLSPASTRGNLYLRDNASGTEELLAPGLEEVGSGAIAGGSTDLGHVVFNSRKHLTSDTPEGATRSLYEYSGGALRNVGILPGSTTPTAGGVSGFGNPFPYGVSEDGSRVFFGAEPDPKEPGEAVAQQVFVRIDGNRTVEVSAPLPQAPDTEAAAQEATFVGASSDGRFAFFTSSAELTADANTGEAERTPNLYRFDVDSGQLLDLSVADQSADEERGADVRGAFVAADGSAAYFFAKGNLAPGAISGETNLYRWKQGAGVTFVASLQGDETVSEPGSNGLRLARTSADGSAFALTSSTPLDPEFPEASVQGVSAPQIYLYSAVDRAIVCVSCTHPGVNHPAEITGGGSYLSNALSSDGNRVFFQTESSLVPFDTNGRIDVYEWEDGAAHLISSGTSNRDSLLIDASPSGNDVFFTTDVRLAPTDVDALTDIYDARVGGGLPAPVGPTAPCEAEACLPPVDGAPPSPTNGSASFNGQGNQHHKHRRKKHPRHKHKHKHHHRHRGRHQRHDANRERPQGKSAAPGKHG